MKIHRKEFIALGIIPEYFLTHLIRKGAATFVDTLCTVSPHMSSMWLRENWKLGGVKDRYIKYEGAGDFVLVGLSVGFLFLRNNFLFPCSTLISKSAPMILKGTVLRLN